MSEPPIDEPRQIRDGEALPLDRLESYLAGLGFPGPISILQFPGGYSNLTYLVRAGARELILRRPPFGADVKGGHDMGREHRILSGLAPVWSKAPGPVAFCEDLSVLGAPFYLMERVRGVILRASMPAGLSIDFARLSEGFVDALAELHVVDVAAAGLHGLGRAEGYVERQVSGWTARWQKARTDAVPAMDEVAAWLSSHRPPDSSGVLVHNDFKYDNVVLDPLDTRRIVAVLDWEMATLGHPVLDLGMSLGYWLQPEDAPALLGAGISGLTALPGNLDRAGVVDRYARVTGRDVSDIVFGYALGLFKIAVIVQQIYARYQRGATSDPRFARLPPVVTACADAAWEAASHDRV